MAVLNSTELKELTKLLDTITTWGKRHGATKIARAATVLLAVGYAPRR
jgi:hypothetical protein